MIVSVLRARRSVKIDQNREPDSTCPVYSSDEIRIGSRDVGFEGKERDYAPVANRYADM